MRNAILIAKKPAKKAQKFESKRYGKLSIKNILSEFDKSILQITPNIIGMLIRNESFAADLLFRPTKRPAIMVDPERDTPGMKANICARPIYSARLRLSFSSFSSFDICGILSTKIIIAPTINNIIATIVRLLKKDEFSIKSPNIKPTAMAGMIVIVTFTKNLKLCSINISLQILMMRGQK